MPPADGDGGGDGGRLPPRLQVAVAASSVGIGATVSVLFPTAYFLVARSDVGRTADHAHLGALTGLLVAAFPLGASLGSVPWGRLSDRIGRVRVTFLTLTGIAVSELLLGFLTHSYAWMLAMRLLSGISNGTAVSLKTLLGELCDDSTQGGAFALLSIGWGFGNVIGPAIGGVLGDPCNAPWWPEDRGCPALLEHYPFCIPFVLIAIVLATSAVMCASFLPETCPAVVGSVGQAAAAAAADVERMRRKIAEPVVVDVDDDDDDCALEDVALLSGSSNRPDASRPATRPDAACWSAIATYASCGFVAVLANELSPLFAASPRDDGGLAYTSTDIGAIAAACGVVILVYTATSFHRLERRYGARQLFMHAIVIVGLTTALTPIVSLLPTFPAQMTYLSVVFALRACAGPTAVTASSMLVTNAAPPGAAGHVNGIAQAIISCCRGLGPALGGAMWSAAVAMAKWLPLHQMLPFAVATALTCVPWTLASRLPDRLNKSRSSMGGTTP